MGSSVDTLRALDRWLGPPLCMALSALRRRRKGPVAEVRRLLVVKLSEMGATVLAHPALSRARELWPACAIYFLVLDRNRRATDLLGLVPPENVLTLSDHSLGSFVASAVRQTRAMRAVGFDAALDLEFFSRASAIFTALSGAPATAGFHRYTQEGLYKGSLYSHPVLYNHHIHTALAFRSLVEALTVSPAQVPLAKVPLPAVEDLKLARVTPTEREIRCVRDRLAESGADIGPQARLVILNCHSSQLVPQRRWPLERFVSLGRALLQEPDVYVVCTGEQADREDALRLQAALASDRCINMAGRTELALLPALYSLCSLMVTNDSGPAHFASVTDLPTITLFGPETPLLYRALGKDKIAISANLACSPCVSAYNHRHTVCNDNLCMQAIGVEQVLAVCRDQLARRRGRPK